MVDVVPGSVLIGMISPGTVQTDFAADMINVGLWSRANGIDLIGVTHASAARINKARADIFREFLQSGAEWFWTVDTDMTIPRDTLQSLLAHTAKGHKVVTGLAFGYAQNPGPGKPAMFPSIFKEKKGHFELQMGYVKDSVFEVDGCGNYCMLFHRDVVKAVGDRYRNQLHPWMMEEKAKDGTPIGPDLVLCRRIRRCGYAILMDSSIQLGHIKSSILGEEQFINYMERVRQDAEE